MAFYKKMDAQELEHWRAIRRKAWERLSPEYRHNRQMLGTRMAIGCVALEITQRCNLDCTLCYLSDLSESIPDPPIEEIKRKADMIVRDWGPNTNVQVTGGDPTLRKREELVEIVRYCRSIGLIPALFTNGIKAKRSLIEELIEVGLTDVAFHVDMTQQRKGYASEMELNEVRAEYIERVRGLPVATVFNTTVFDGNVHEIPDLVRFFRKNSDVVGMCSFQLGADTGRGTNKVGCPTEHHNMRKVVEEGFGTALNWEAVQFGHPRCHSIAYTLQTGDGHTIDLGEDTSLGEALMEHLPDVEMDRTRPMKVALDMTKGFLSKPPLAKIGLRWLGRTLVKHGAHVVKGGFKVHKLSVFIQNFMDADNLEPDRIANCSFMVATNEGTVSMCLHNARRDEFITVGVKNLIKNPAKRGVPREAPAALPPELQGPVRPGGAGLPTGPTASTTTTTSIDAE